MRIKNILWNLLGLGIPLIIAAATIPALIDRLGTERFGLLAMAWGLTALSGLFDLGIGRAATQAVSAYIGASQQSNVPVVVYVAARLAIITGLAGGIFFAALVLLGIQNNLKFSPILTTEVFWAFLLLAFVIPLQSVSAMYRGINEAFENFRYISLIRAGLGVASFAGPLAITYWTNQLPWLFASLVISRAIGFYFYRRAAQQHTNSSSKSTLAYSADVRMQIRARLLSFGGWFTISNIIYPLLGQVDRWFIGTLISAAAVTSYVVPFDLIGQSLTIVGAVTTVAFPNITSRIQNDGVRATFEFRRILLFMVGLMTVVTIGLILIMPSLLPLWLGTDFPKVGIEVGQVLALGLVPFTIGSMYLVIIHAHQRVDINAKSHVIQVAIFLPAIYWAVSHYGPVGAAWCWVARNTVDAMLTIIWFNCRDRSREISSV